MDFAEQVKAQVDIVVTVREYLPLRKAGGRFVGLCPFHTEKSPSFGVNPALGIYKCFGCGAGGDVIKFVQEIETLTFWEALKALAERNGIPIPQRADRPHDPDTDLRAALFEMHEQASVYFAQNLFGAAGSDVREYLTKRGLASSAAQQFLLGYSEPSWDSLLRRFGSRYSPAQLEASGLFGKRDDGGLYDKFRGRLMFPIHNESGKIIAFGGRALRAEDEPKYLNSQKTPIYDKSSVLYNLHRAKDGIRKGGRGILVEGYMDVIGVFSAGVRNVVASCGTALTATQVRTLKRFSPNVVVNFDPDNAGANATERSIQMLLEEGVKMRVLELENGLDPDEYIQQRGAEAYSERLNRAANYFIWLADRARKKFSGNSAEARVEGYNALLLPALRKIHDPLERAAVATEIADYLGLDRNLVLAEFRKMPGQNRIPGSGSPAPAKKPLVIPHRERMLIRGLVQDVELRNLLLPRLTGYATVKAFVTWPVIEAVSALLEEDPRFDYSLLESRVEEGTRALMFEALFTDTSSDVLSCEQADVFLNMVETEEQSYRQREVSRAIQQAERSGNLEEAMRLMAPLSERKCRNRARTD
ncbi:MAG: DNA primase [Bryobacteraceae bacterium]|nr:DNA primase [Bryobacteraceae bacterium]